MTRCQTHKKYRGAQAPRRSKHYPDGCETCWKIYYEVGQKAAEEAAKPKRKPATVKTITDKAAPGMKIRMEVDALTGEYALMDGKRCLYVGVTMDEVEAFITGYGEGMRRSSYGL